MDEVRHEYGLACLPSAPPSGQYHAIIVSVAHQQFIQIGVDGIKAWGQPNAMVYDVKSILPRGGADGRL